MGTYNKDRSVSYPSRGRGKHWVIGFEAEPAWSDNTRTVTCVRTLQGDRLPNFREIIKNDGNAVTAMTATRDEIQCDIPGSVYVRGERTAPNYEALYMNEGDILSTNSRQYFLPATSSVSTSFADDKANANFRKKVNEFSTPFQGMIFAGELKETLQMLRHPAAGLRNNANGYMNSLTKQLKGSKDAKRIAKTASDLWLEHSFGWMPFLQDIKSAAEAWRRATGKQPDHKVSAGFKIEYDRTKYSLTGPWELPGAVTTLSNGCAFRVTANKVIERHIVRYKGKITAQVEAPQWNNPELWGFTPSQFIPTAWELLPWSFLADYFTNIGDLLESTLTKTQNLAFVNKTVIVETDKQGRVVLDPAATVQIYGGSAWKVKSSSQVGPWTMNYKRRSVWRTPGVALPFPSFHFDSGLSVGQITNIAALFGSAMKIYPQNPIRTPYRR